MNPRFEPLIAEQERSAPNTPASRAVTIDPRALPTPGPSRVRTLSPEAARSAQRARMIQETSKRPSDLGHLEICRFDLITSSGGF